VTLDAAEIPETDINVKTSLPYLSAAGMENFREFLRRIK
jgi:hypothetical protein